MFNREIDEADTRAKDAIRFRRKGGGYYCPDLLVDRNALKLLKVQYKPTKDADNVLEQLSGLAWVMILD